MQFLVNFLSNSLYGGQNRKRNDEILACKSGAWMMTECQENVKE